MSKPPILKIHSNLDDHPDYSTNDRSEIRPSDRRSSDQPSSPALDSQDFQDLDSLVSEITSNRPNPKSPTSGKSKSTKSSTPPIEPDSPSPSAPASPMQSLGETKKLSRKVSKASTSPEPTNPEPINQQAEPQVYHLVSSPDGLPSRCVRCSTKDDLHREIQLEMSRCVAEDLAMWVFADGTQLQLPTVNEFDSPLAILVTKGSPVYELIPSPDQQSESMIDGRLIRRNDNMDDSLSADQILAEADDGDDFFN